jgi:hypothetical protein
VGYAAFFTPAVRVGSGGENARLMAFAAGPDDLGPVVISGRRPAGDAEVLLNPLLADALGVQIGDRVELTISEFGVEGEADVLPIDLPTGTFDVVGTGAVPLGDDAYDISIATTIAGYRSLLPPDEAKAIAGGADFLLLNRADGVSTEQIVDRLADLGVTYEPIAPTSDEFLDNIVSVDRTSTESVPDLLGVLMAFAGGSVLVYTVVTTIGRNRRDLGIAQALGFDRSLIQRSARVAGAAQAVAGLLVAVPGGIIIGRAAWQVYERSLGVVPGTAVPAFDISLVVIAALALAVGAASLAARRLCRGSVASVLRASE